jgi:hypothetical protein
MATDDAQTTSTTTSTGTDTAAMSPRDRAMAVLDSMGWDEDDDATEPDPQAETTTSPAAEDKPATAATEPDPLAELAAKVEAKLKAKPATTTPAVKPTWDKAAYKANPFAYLESLGIDPVEVGDTLNEYASLKPEERQARARDAELERFRQAEKLRKEQEAAAQEVQSIEAAEKDYLAHVESDKTKYPHLAALDSEDILRHSSHVAQLIVDAGEDAGPDRLAEYTELYVAKLASKLPGAGARGYKKTAVAGDRTGSSADGGAPQTITSHLAAESGSPAERDLSPEGRRAAAMRKAASLGW